MKKKQTHAKKTSTIHKHLRHALVPHKGNQYRPHAMRLHGITAVLVIAVLMQVVYGFATTGRLAVLSRTSTIDITQLLEKTNQERTVEGAPELTIDADLSTAARLKAADMLEYDYWAHTSPSGVTPWRWLGVVGYQYDVAGENLAKNYPNATSTVAAWMASPGHRENLLNPAYSEVGFAVAEGELSGEATTLVVALYAAPAGGGAVVGATDEGSVDASPVAQSMNLLSYLNSAMLSLSPASLIGIGLFIAVGLVAVAAHHYRDRLPKSWRQSWRRHHGIFTLIAMGGLSFLVIFATGGGQL